MAVGIAVVGLVSAACAMLSGWSWYLQLPVLVAISLGAAREIRRTALLSTSTSVVTLALADNQVSVWRRGDRADSDGTVCTVRHRFVHARVVVLVLKPVMPGTGFRLVLTRGMCGRDQFRMLKRFLLWNLEEQQSRPVDA